jgi:hypothetical protein
LPLLKKQVFFLFFLTSFFLKGQITKVKGTIKDANSKETMPFVNLVFKGTTIGTSSDINGFYDLSAQRAADTLLVSFMGYKSQKIGISRFKTTELNIELQPDNYTLREVIIRPGENPAHKIMREVVAHKNVNTPSNVQSYQYEVYNKIQFDINNFKEGFTKQAMLKPFDFVFNYADTTEDGKQYLPLAITETYTNVSFSNDPSRKKEEIIASQISGIKNSSISQFLGDMYQNVNIYENFLLIFNKSFVSPVTDNFLRYYKYYLVDSVYIGNERCYKLLFLPKRKQDLTFTGNLYIHDSTFAVKQVNIRFNDNANINYIKQFDVFQEYGRVDGKQWMLTYEKSVGDFAPFEKANGKGFFGRKSTRYKNFKINIDLPDSLFQAGQEIIVSDSADQRSDMYWNTIRPDTLTKTERGVYAMVDSLRHVPRLIKIVNLGQLIATGYFHSKWLEIGRYFTFASWNEIEGVRLKVGGITTSDFNKRLELRGWLAYGLNDERFKVVTGLSYFIDKDKSKRRLLSLAYKSDLEQLSLSANSLALDNILTSIIRRTALKNVTNVEEAMAMMEYDWIPGFSNKLIFFNRRLVPLGDFSFEKLNSDGQKYSLKQITTTEINLQTRFAWGEKYISGKFKRRKIASRYPVIQFDVGLGVPQVFGSQFSYTKTRIRISDRLRLNALGYTDYVVDLGKIWGKAPYFFLELHQGSQTYALDKMAFNMMNIFEFASDRYAYLFLDHHFEGFFLNKIPLLRKLKWREVLTLKSVVGDMRPENINQLVYPGGIDPQIHRPYLESGFAIENIFKIIRVDLLWRMTHLERPDAKPFGLRASFSLRF